MKKIFVDTAIFRYASRLSVKTAASQGNGYITKADTKETTPCTAIICGTKITPPKMNESLTDELAAISVIAQAAKDGVCTLVYSHEVNLELFCQPAVDIVGGRFQGAPCTIIHSPCLKVSKDSFDSNDTEEYPLTIYPEKKSQPTNPSLDEHANKSIVEGFMRDQLLSSPINSFAHYLNFWHLMAMTKATTGYSANTPKLLFPLLDKIVDKRYIEILEMLKVKGMTRIKKPNGYMDALHIWAAEVESCDIFLTSDKGICTNYKGESLRAMKPEKLANELVPLNSIESLS